MKGGNDHFWAIDDVKIIQKEANDLQLDQIYFGSIGNLEVPINYHSVQYGNHSDNIVFGAVISNAGSNMLSNIKVFLDLNNGGFQDTISVFNLQSGDSDTLFFTKPFSNIDFSIGYNLLTINLECDSVESNMFNNVDSVIINNNLGYELWRSEQTNSGKVYNYGDYVEMGLLFDNYAYTSWPANGVMIKLDRLTSEYTLVYPILYELDTINNEFNFVMIGYDYNITNADINLESILMLNFSSSIFLDSNKTYLVAVGSYGGSSNNDLVLKSDSFVEEGTAFIYDYDNSLYWETLISKPLIALHFHYDEITENSSITSISNFPNPVSSFTTIEFKNSQSEDFELQITDLQGKKVHTQNLGKIKPGKHLIEFDASQLPSGTYIYSIGNENGKASKSMMVLK